MVKDQNIRHYGTLEATQTNIKTGDAMFWDAAGTLQICGINDHYRYAGQALIIGNTYTADGGDEIALDVWGVRHAYGDDATYTYVLGQKLTTGAAGILIPMEDSRNYAHTVTGGEAAAGVITLPAYVGQVLGAYNNNLNISFVPTGIGAAPGLGEMLMTNTLNVLTATLNLAELNAADVINFTYAPKNGVIGKQVSALDTNDRFNVQLGGN